MVRAVELQKRQPIGDSVTAERRQGQISSTPRARRARGFRTRVELVVTGRAAPGHMTSHALRATAWPRCRRTGTGTARRSDTDKLGDYTLSADWLAQKPGSPAHQTLIVCR